MRPVYARPAAAVYGSRFCKCKWNGFPRVSDHNASSALISIYTTPLQQNRINEVIPVRMANWRDIF